MRIWKKEDDLKMLAEKISEEIVIRSYTSGTSYDTRRKTTAVEKNILYKLAYGALLGLNYGDEARNTPEAERAILNTTEFMAKLFIPECNGYDSIYIPLEKTLKEWEENK